MRTTLPLVAALGVSFVFGARPASLTGGAADVARLREEDSDANDNRVPAGTHSGDTLVLRLTVAPVTWRIFGDSNPGFHLFALAEEGKRPTIPAPLLRVRVGTPVRVTFRNPLDDTLTVRGLGEHAGAQDSLLVLPNGTAVVAFVPQRVGTYQYWVAISASQRVLPPDARRQGLIRPLMDSQLAGAFVVDPTGPTPPDRIFVITEINDLSLGATRDRHGVPAREFTALNGRSWPYTERLQHAVGDTVRWRIINTTFQAHPMHLHGFYFRVDSHGSARDGIDSIYAPQQRRMAVTEVVGIGESMSIAWSPDRPGAWVMHCHLTNHAARLPPVDQQSMIEYGIGHDHGDPDQHFVNGMNGLILGVTVTGARPAAAAWRPSSRLRLFVQSDSTARDSTRRFGYVLQRGAEPRRDSIERPGPVLILRRGEPTSITVINRTNEPTAVHWHGIEIESYFDGAVGWSTNGTRTQPAIRPESSFEVHITPKRAGTFLYHTHFNEMRQQFGGLVGPLIVLEPGQRPDPEHDLLFLISDGDAGRLAINGEMTPAPKVLRAGTTYRLRIADIAGFRQSSFAQVMRDSTPASWRPVAKDGFALPAEQATLRPAVARMSSGETGDFELTPTNPGELRLEVVRSTRVGLQPEIVVPLRVLPPP